MYQIGKLKNLKPRPNATEGEFLLACVELYIFPPDYESNPIYVTQYWQLYTQLKQMICYEFIRHSVEKELKNESLPRQSKALLKEEIRVQARLLSKVWVVIKLLPELPKDKFVIFWELLHEETLVMFIFARNGTTTATAFCKNEQQNNRQLQTLKNPFDPEQNPATWCFIDNCIRQAEKSDDFRRYYMEMIDFRMQCAQHLIKNQPFLVDQDCRKRPKRRCRSVKF